MCTSRKKYFNVMASILPVMEFVDLLCCKCSAEGQWIETSTGVRCKLCGREYNRNGFVLDLIDDANVDEYARKERNLYVKKVDVSHLSKMVLLEQSSIWKSYRSRSRMVPMRWLATRISACNYDTICLMGAGSGRELLYFNEYITFKKILCSDIAVDRLKMIPLRCEQYGYQLALFTADIKKCPVISKSIPIIAINVFHHTKDMHAIIEIYCKNNHRTILFLEPCENFILKFFSRFGLAIRREYSGIIPGRLNLKQLRLIAMRYNYCLRCKTFWTFPQDYYNRFFGKWASIRKPFLKMMDVFSAVTSLVNFGNNIVVHLEKKN